MTRALLAEWQAHIKSPFADEERLAICGAKLHGFDWKFMGVDHAFAALKTGTRMQPCPDCAAAVIGLFQEVPK